MTTSRIVRGTKARIFLYLSAVLIITGIIACYNNTLSQLQHAKKSNDICHQQEENLSTQLQVISDYKLRLEKSLKTEKAEHQQAKTELENKLNEERSKREKAASDANLQFSSLQQHYNLLKTQHDDYKTECGRTQNAQSKEVNDLQAKLKEVQEELKKVNSSKESLKSQYLQSKIEEDILKKELNKYTTSSDDPQSEINHLTKVNNEMQRELETLREKCFNADVMAGEPVAVPPENPPSLNVIKLPSKSTTSASVRSSDSKINVVSPLVIPAVTPKTANISSTLKVPQGVVPIPKKADVEKNSEQKDAVNNRYLIKMSDQEDLKKNEEAENGANEILDQPLANPDDQIGFGDLNEIKANPKQHINNLAIGERPNYDYKDNHDLPAEENEDDDPDEYGDLRHMKEPAIRN